MLLAVRSPANFLTIDTTGRIPANSTTDRRLRRRNDERLVPDRAGMNCCAASSSAAMAEDAYERIRRGRGKNHWINPF